ncbi:PatA/PatG family cyanobactin maturation protease [Ancylobacter radicis]|uniref:PatA/PatG family cyanobactin maturation protease n=1 Tax=Ancylobacter radicis TaxID=2836179 RepID=A0ABS5R2A2_9HYPH|nr:PatA/PatG family cyanobactin maturation protease [Ancylobacter radicis]MBS9475627.1 PatA/PatG family cyanobactin maturation protease [Ancylobacter radicis]
MHITAAGQQGQTQVTVAVLDGPVDLDHACFRGAQIELPLGQPEPLDSSAATLHGTHVASLLFGQIGSEVAGLIPACRGLIIPIFTGDGDRLAASQLDLARAILVAVENGAHFINISGGQLSPSGAPDPVLAQAIARCAERNVLIIAAAGNDGCACLHVPAAVPSVLAVGALGTDGAPLASSNWGALYRTQGLLAPGQEILGARAGGGTARRSGTSYAAPHVAGQAARLAALQIACGHAPDPHAIRAALLETAIPCPDESAADCARFLAGRLDIIGATARIQGGCAMSDSLHVPIADATIRDTAPRPLASARIMASGEPAPEPSATDASPGPEQATVTPSDCGCGCGGKKKAEGGGCGCGCGGKGQAPARPQLVYALGRVGYDFGSEARRDSFMQAMAGEANNPLHPDHWLGHLDAKPYDAASVIWTLNLDATPIYAIHPVGAFGDTGYKMLRDAFKAQIHEGAEIVSIPGVISGTARLQSGQTVPVIVPAIRGIYCWNPQAIIDAILGMQPMAATDQDTYDRFSAGLTNFLSRVYYDLRNLGITGEERALNYSATNASQIASVLQSTTRQQLDLDSIMVKKSPVCRPDSDCYDVEIAFFNPDNTNVASRIYRFTVDVSDVVPVTVGTVRSWARRV